MSVQIYKDIKFGIDRLNKTIISTDMTLLAPGERAYLLKRKPYASTIHIAPVAESAELHFTNAVSLENDPSLHGFLYAGTAGAVNLEYIASSRAAGAILYDINAFQTFFWNVILQEMARQPDRHAFVSFLYEMDKEVTNAIVQKYNLDNLHEPYIRNSIEKYKSAYRIDHDEDALNPFEVWSSFEQSWMNDDDRYAHLHTLAKNNAIGALTLDVFDLGSCHQLRQFLDEAGVDVGILYRSNILNILGFSGRRHPHESVIEGYMDLWLSKPNAIDIRKTDMDTNYRPSPTVAPAPAVNLYGPMEWDKDPAAIDWEFQ